MRSAPKSETVAVVAHRPGNIPELHESRIRILRSTPSRKKNGSACRLPLTKLQIAHPPQTPVHLPTSLAGTPERASLRQGRGRGTKSHVVVAATASTTTTGNTNHHQLTDDSTMSTVVMANELRHPYSPRRHLRHHSAAGPKTTPTIYTPEPQSRGSPALPPPKQPAEREGTDGLAGGGKRKTCRLPFAYLMYCRRRGKGSRGGRRGLGLQRAVDDLGQIGWEFGRGNKSG
jgi:hypothetical protein